MKFCTYNLCIVCYFLYVQFHKSVIFVRTICAHFDVLYVQFWYFSHFVRTILPTFYEKYRPNLEVFKDKNGLKTVKTGIIWGSQNIFVRTKSAFLGYFWGILTIFCPFCGQKPTFIPHFNYM